MIKEFKFAIIGSGNISNTYVNAINNIDNASISAIVSRTGKTPNALKGSAIEIAESIVAIKSDFDAVIVTTPNGLHCQPTLQAAELEKHVLTEKPLDVTIEAMEKMISRCKEKNITLAVAFQRRVSPDNISVKKLIEKNSFGRIYSADLSAKFYRGDDYFNSASYRGTKAIDGGGVFTHQASHNIDIYQWFFGLPEKTVSFLDTFAHNIEVEDHGAAILRYSNGMIGSIVASTVSKPGFLSRLEINAEKGSVILENDIITTWEVEGIENPSVKPVGKIHTGNSATVSDTSGHEAIIKDFIDAIGNDREPIVSGESAKRTTELILGIYEASKAE